jgi:hypothetical protein
MITTRRAKSLMLKLIGEANKEELVVSKFVLVDSPVYSPSSTSAGQSQEIMPSKTLKTS